jgi:NAD(P)-dependent dehydrogenase (short-subunit alcohol dehydrogenase family)
LSAEHSAASFAAGAEAGGFFCALGTPEEVAHALLFLASSGASHITGVDLNVDGGSGQL